MKKLILSLMFLVSLVSMSNWKTIELVDDFKEPTGNVAIIGYSTKNDSFFKIEKYNDSTLFIIRTDDFIGKKYKEYNNVKFKIDGNNVISSRGLVLDSDSKMVIVSTDLDRINILNILEQMKHGEIMKIVIEKYNGSTLYFDYDLQGFKEIFEKLK
ncbi:hypothetical protein [Cetobacterium sp.]|uniref:hypothetical protein n=1 Tax=Cetobacterium sp. TaxID=2071632 RepID=UPI003EE6A1EB